MSVELSITVGAFFFFFNDTAPTEIYTLPLHDALPIPARLTAEPAEDLRVDDAQARTRQHRDRQLRDHRHVKRRSEEHTSELQSRLHLVCRLLLEKKKNHTATRRAVDCHVDQALEPTSL